MVNAPASACSRWQKRHASPCLQPPFVVKWMQGVHFLASSLSILSNTTLDSRKPRLRLRDPETS